MAVVVALAGIGAFLVATGFQTADYNWAGQWCGMAAAYAKTCIHPEWIALGSAGLVAAAILFFKWPENSN